MSEEREIAHFYKAATPNDDELELTDSGKSKFARWFNTHYVADNDDTMSWYGAWEASSEDELEGVPESFAGRCLSNDTMRDALRYAGAQFVNEHQIRARRRDALGLSFRGDCSPTDPSWLVRGLIPSSSVGMLVGPPGELKTWAMLSLASAVASLEATHWCGFELDPHRRRKALVCDWENGREEIDRRRTIAGDKGRIGVACFPPVSLDDPGFWSAIESQNATLVGLDSLSRGNPEPDEKDARFATPLTLAGKLAANGTTSVFLHHSPKSGGKTLNDALRGTSAIGAALDWCYLVEAVSSPREGEYRSRLTCLKMRRGRYQPEPFIVSLTDEHGVQRVEETRGRKNVEPKTDDDLVLEAVRANPGAEGGTTGIVEATGIGKDRVREARQRLEAAGLIVNKGNRQQPRYYPADGPGELAKELAD